MRSRRVVSVVGVFVLFFLPSVAGAPAAVADPPMPENSSALAINDRGQVIGFAEIAPNSFHAFIWHKGVLRDLGTLGGDVARANAINEHGAVVGSASLPGNDPVHAFVWKNGVMTDLGTLGGVFSEGTAINKHGQVVGDSLLGDPAPDCPSCPHAVLWSNGVMTDLGTPGDAGDFSTASGLNDHGVVFGAWAKFGEGQRSFVWRNGVSTDLGGLGSDFVSGFTIANDINKQGQIVGTSVTAAGDHHAFLWSDGVMTDLRPIAGETSAGIDINDKGQVAIDVGAPGFGTGRALVWDEGFTIDVGNLGGETRATGINERGWVTGVSATADGSSHAFVWPKGVIRDLGTLGGSYSFPAPAPPGGRSINKKGDVVGASGITGDVAGHAFFWRKGKLTDIGTL